MRVAYSLCVIAVVAVINAVVSVIVKQASGRKNALAQLKPTKKFLKITTTKRSIGDSKRAVLEDINSSSDYQDP